VFLAAGDPAVAPLIAGGASAVEVADEIWSTQVRYLGVGAMLVGGVWALISLRGSLLSVVKAGLASFRAGERREVPHYERDMPMPLVLGGVVLSVVPIFFAYNAISEDFGPAVTVPMTLIMVAAAFLFSSVAAYMAGLVGSSNNPISGVTIATILLSAVLLSGLVSVTGASAGPAAAILIGAVVASAAAIGGDNMQDLKAGYLLGATPWRQQVMQIVGVLSAVLFMAPILNLLLEAYGIGVPTERHPNPLIAPQAALMASVARGVFAGGLPWNMVIAGAVLGAAIILFDEWLGRRGSGWRAPVLAVAVGIYLPLELTVPILAGGLIAALVERANRARADAAAADRRRRIGTLMAAGLITGEAIMGILLAIPIVASGDRDVLAIAAEPLGGMPGLLALAAIAYWLYRRVTRAAVG
jgi:putative OPT family oligopeptide transporter